MTRRHNMQQRLNLERLEERAIPSVGTFVEDFTNDTFAYRNRGGFDTAMDGVRIKVDPGLARHPSFVATPAGGPAGAHSLRLARGLQNVSDFYAGWVTYGPNIGELSPWECVAEASITVRGAGTVSFYGDTSLSFTNTAPADQWVTFRVTSDMQGGGGRAINSIRTFVVSAMDEMLVDDVTLHVERRVGGAVPAEGVGPGVVRVHRFGNGMSVVGDAKNNSVQIELPYDDAGTIRVSDPRRGTRIIAGAAAIQIDDYTVEVVDFAHAQSIVDGVKQLPDRDILVNLGYGDDQLHVIGGNWTSPVKSIDDLIINTGAGDSLTYLENLFLWGELAFQGGAGEDYLESVGRTRMFGIRVNTGAGADEVRLGTPGDKVFDGEKLSEHVIAGEYRLNRAFVRRMLNWVDTGSGNDNVYVAGAIRHVTFLLGTGSDTIRFESMFGEGTEVRTGYGLDRIDFCESEMFGIRLSQDADDTIRMHRVLFGDRNQLLGRDGIRVQIPASGTQARFFTNPDATYSPGDSMEVLKGILYVFGIEWGMPMYERCRVEFAQADF